MANETIILNTEDVKVTSARLVIKESGKTYAMRQITSVQCIAIPPDNAAAVQCIIWGAIGSLCLGLGLILVAVGIILLVLGRTRYALSVHTAGGEGQYLVDFDAEEIERIVLAVNNAIIAIG